MAPPEGSTAPSDGDGRLSNPPGDDVGIYVMPYGATIDASATGTLRRLRLEPLGVEGAHGEIVATTAKCCAIRRGGRPACVAGRLVSEYRRRSYNWPSGLQSGVMDSEIRDP